MPREEGGAGAGSPTPSREEPSREFWQVGRRRRVGATVEVSFFFSLRESTSARKKEGTRERLAGASYEKRRERALAPEREEETEQKARAPGHSLEAGC